MAKLKLRISFLKLLMSFVNNALDSLEFSSAFVNNVMAGYKLAMVFIKLALESIKRALALKYLKKIIDIQVSVIMLPFDEVVAILTSNQ